MASFIASLITEFLLMIVKLVGFGLLLYIPIIILVTRSKMKHAKREEERMRRLDEAAQRIIESTKQR